MKPVLFVFGWISFVLGIIGAFLPLLPTTPFLILSAFLFSKSSPKFHAWLLKLPVAGDGIRDWESNRVVRPRAKILCVLMIIVSIASVWYFTSMNLFIALPVSLLLIGVAIFVASQKSS